LTASVTKFTVSKRIDPNLLVQYITRLATQRGAVLSPLRLVKLLYLADLYCARENSGVTLTGWPWAFVYYGPYCREAMQAIDASVIRNLIAALPYKSKYDDDEHYVYRCDSDVKGVEDQLPIYITSPLKEAVRKWADDSPRLLDHVYFETEPMIGASPGQRLDLSLARRPTREKPLPMLSMPKEKLEAARARVAKLALRYREQSVVRESELHREPRDAEYNKTVEVLNGEPLSEGLVGEATIRSRTEDENH
jgi:hypothetical protein